MRLSFLWVTLGLAVLAALAALTVEPRSTEAAYQNCGTSGEDVTVEIVQVDKGNARIPVPGAVVRFTPDTLTGRSDDQVVDNEAEDASTTVGRIRQEDVCNTTATSTYSVALVALPLNLVCDVVTGSRSNLAVPDGTSVTTTLVVRNCQVYNIVISKDAEPDTTDPFLFAVQGSRLGCNGTYTVRDQALLGLKCPTPAIYLVMEERKSGWMLDRLDCATVGQAIVQRDLNQRLVRIELRTATDGVKCSFHNIKEPPKPETISFLGPRHVGSQSVSHLIVQVKTATGAAVPDGTRVELDASLGRVLPSVAFTRNGSVLAAYTSPPGIGSATITARADNVVGQAYIRFGPCPDVEGLRLRCVSVQCPEMAGDRTFVTFSWTPVPGAVLQWLDLSLYNNNFQWRTFLGAGPLPAGASSLTWPGLLPGFTHYWRVNALMPDGTWRPSETGVFVPCPAPVP